MSRLRIVGVGTILAVISAAGAERPLTLGVEVFDLEERRIEDPNARIRLKGSGDRDLKGSGKTLLIDLNRNQMCDAGAASFQLDVKARDGILGRTLRLMVTEFAFGVSSHIQFT